MKYSFNPDGISIKGCTYIYAPAGQAGEYAPLAANPYRGCGHKCVYCVSGSTLVTMEDGSAKRISSIMAGDRILGISVIGNDRAWNTRIVPATVVACAVSNKQAYRIETEDGTVVICSGDHRWLTDRGWKYTCPSEDGQRPYLTTNNSIRKVGSAHKTPEESDDYKIGYLAGMIRGDANLAIYDYSDKRRKSGKTMGIQHRFRLALKDLCAINRTKKYLAYFGVETTDFPFKNKYGVMFAIGTTSPERVARIKSITDTRHTYEWKRGWIAGIFDAEGSHGRNALKISNSDNDILSITEDALSTLGFQNSRKPVKESNVSYIIVHGGRNETFRFWQIVNPAIKRKFDVIGRAVSDSVRVVSIERLNFTDVMYDIMTTSETFIANGLVSHNCYVPRMLKMERKEFDQGAIERPNFISYLTKDARKYQAMGVTEQVMLSFTTDPYHPGDNSFTRRTIEILQASGLGFCTLTKGGRRALRDLHLFRPDRDAFATTLTSLDDSFSLKWESGAALPGDRIDTLRMFHENGIFTWVSLEPTLDIESSLKIVEVTHGFVDLYKIGRVNYLPMTRTTDWEGYTQRMIDLCQRLGVKHYIKKDLQCYLPEGYPNHRRVNQFHGSIPVQPGAVKGEQISLF